MDVVYKLRKEVADLGRRLIKSGLTYGTSGNISARIPGEEKIVISPSNVPYGEIKPEDVLVVDFDGNVLEGERNPSLELKMHLGVYKARPDVNAVIHAHPVYANVLSCTGKCIPPFLDEMVPIVGGSIDVAEYGVPGSEELAKNAVKALGKKSAALLANHGIICCGGNLEKTFEIAGEVERIAKVYVLSMILGGPKMLPEKVVEFQKNIYEMMKEL